MLIIRAAFLAISSLSLAGVPVLAQTLQKELPPLENTDILIQGSATARELRFGSKPESHIRFWGTPHRNSDWVTERQNLPKDVEPGVTYRNIGINITIFSIFDKEAILKEVIPPTPSSPTP
jgi:hypothetical protein